MNFNSVQTFLKISEYYEAIFFFNKVLDWFSTANIQQEKATPRKIMPSAIAITWYNVEDTFLQLPFVLIG